MRLLGSILLALGGAGAGLLLAPLLAPGAEPGFSPADRHVTYWLEIDAQGAVPVRLERARVEYRAFVPCPRIEIANENAEATAGLHVVISNLNPDFVAPPANVLSWDWIGPTTLRLVVEVAPGGRLELELRDAHPERTVRTFLAADPEANFVVLERFLEEAGRERPDFVWILGDFVQENPWYFEYYRRLLDRAPVPVYTTIGNHDLAGDRRNPPFEARKEAYRKAFGPTRYAFVFRGVQFVALDTSAPYVPSEDLAWLERTLAEGEAARRFVLTHKPFEDPRPGEDHQIEDRRDRERLAEILGAHEEAVYYCGHIEAYFSYEAHGTPVRIVGSLAFSNVLAETEEGKANSYLRVEASGASLVEERAGLEESRWHETACYYATRVFPVWLGGRPSTALGIALVLAALAGGFLRWRAARKRGTSTLEGP